MSIFYILLSSLLQAFKSSVLTHRIDQLSSIIRREALASRTLNKGGVGRAVERCISTGMRSEELSELAIQGRK